MPDIDFPKVRTTPEGQMFILGRIKAAHEALQYELGKPAVDPQMLHMYETEINRFKAQLPVPLRQSLPSPQYMTAEDIDGVMARVHAGYDPVQDFDLGFGKERGEVMAWWEDFQESIAGAETFLIVGAVLFLVLLIRR